MEIAELEVFRFLTGVAHGIATDHGWWEDGKEASPLESHMLFVNEVSESVEEIREGRALDEIYYKHEEGCEVSEEISMLYGSAVGCTCTPKPEGSPVELADVFIRIFDYLGQHGLEDVFIRAYVEKTEYNRSRPYRHGGKTK